MPWQPRIALSKHKTCNHSWQESRDTRAPLKAMLRMPRPTNSQLMPRKISPYRRNWMLRKTKGTSLLCRVIWAHFRALLLKQTPPIPIQRVNTMMLLKCSLALKLNSQIWILLFNKFLATRIKLRLQRIWLKPTNPTPPRKCKSLLLQEQLLPSMKPILSTTMQSPSTTKPSLHRQQPTSQSLLLDNPKSALKAAKKMLTGMLLKSQLLSLTLRLAQFLLWTSGLNLSLLLRMTVSSTTQLK